MNVSVEVYNESDYIDSLKDLYYPNIAHRDGYITVGGRSLRMEFLHEDRIVVATTYEPHDFLLFGQKVWIRQTLPQNACFVIEETVFPTVGDHS